MATFKVLLVTPTRNGASDLKRLLASISTQTRTADICVVDSSSSDATVDVARTSHACVHSIQVSDFNHGGTRQLMVDEHPDYDIYVFMTQDAYLEDERALECILEPFGDASVGAVCGRQLPHLDANPIAEHARFFNYPAESRIKSMEDAAELGVKTPFISNSFAAYRRDALTDVGGFPSHVILSEDMYVVARMLVKGWKMAYSADARCRHSHNYTVLEEFRRYFDIGVFHAREPWIRETFGGAGSEGVRYLKSELSFLGLDRVYIWPAALARNAVKLLGYKLGRLERMLPRGVKEYLSMHRTYWRGPNA